MQRINGVRDWDQGLHWKDTQYVEVEKLPMISKTIESYKKDEQNKKTSAIFHNLKFTNAKTELRNRGGKDQQILTAKNIGRSVTLCNAAVINNEFLLQRSVHPGTKN